MGLEFHRPSIGLTPCPRLRWAQNLREFRGPVERGHDLPHSLLLLSLYRVAQKSQFFGTS